MYAKVGETAWSLFWCALEMTTSKDDWKQHVLKKAGPPRGCIILSFLTLPRLLFSMKTTLKCMWSEHVSHGLVRPLGSN